VPDHSEITEHPLKLTSHRSNWHKYKKYVSPYIELTTHLNTEADIDCFEDDLQSILDTAPKISTPEGTEVQAYQHKTNQQIEQLVSDKGCLRRAWQASRSPHSKELLKAASPNQTKVIKRAEENAQRRYIEKLSPNSKKLLLWRTHPNLIQYNFFWKLGSNRRRHSPNTCSASQKCISAQLCSSVI